jgi:hypothetical protein
LGTIEVPADRLWDTQRQRSLVTEMEFHWDETSSSLACTRTRVGKLLDQRLEITQQRRDPLRDVG